MVASFPGLLSRSELLNLLHNSTTVSRVHQVHAQLITRALFSDPFVASRLLSTICELSAHVPASYADLVFSQSHQPSTFSWNTIIRFHVRSSNPNKAVLLFARMRQAGVLTDHYTYPFVLKACALLAGLEEGAAIHGDVLKKGLGEDPFVMNGLISLYCKGGEIAAARELFDVMPERNVISWSILIDGYVKHGDPKEALELFQSMLGQGVRPDVISAVGAISACSQLGALDQGRWIHSYVKKHNILLDVVVETALIDMYMKCGSLDLARLLFDEMPRKSVVTWSVMIVGLGMNGFGCEAVELFYQMERRGATMDDLTFLGVLTACTHARLVCEGREIFDRMRRDFRVEPKVEHYGCLVDLLGRAGRLQEAREVIETMPGKPTSSLWGSLLASCRTHRCVELAEVVVEKLKKLGADDGGVYVIMSNIYAAEGMWNQVWKMRKLMRDRGMKKETGRSVIEVDGTIREFVRGDCSHPHNEEIYEVLGSLSNAMP
ncbi:PPR repeat [Musa troglodytarum]|uniref:PPR repeat n=1 Tax=Musa troglodytarum TaxID=320322 RepID=A0A9E7K8F5_9LILI|nr:PPR repeat [Musa troglodytarum]